MAFLKMLSKLFCVYNTDKGFERLNPLFTCQLLLCGLGLMGICWKPWQQWCLYQFYQCLSGLCFVSHHTKQQLFFVFFPHKLIIFVFLFCQKSTSYLFLVLNFFCQRRANSLGMLKTFFSRISTHC